MTNTIETVARECATEALAQGAPARELGDQEAPFAADYACLAEVLGRSPTRAECRHFRECYSATLARGD